MDDIKNDIQTVTFKEPSTINEYLIDVSKKLKLMEGKSLDEEIDPKTPTIELSKKIYSSINKIAQIDKLGKPKKFNLKRKIKGNIQSAFKKNSVIVIMLKRNRDVELVVKKLHNGCIVINDVPRPIEKDTVYMIKINDKQYPTIILPEWELTPIGTERYYQKFPNGLDLDSIVQIIYAYSKSNEVKSQSSMSPMLVIGGIIAVIVVIFIISGGASGK